MPETRRSQGPSTNSDTNQRNSDQNSDSTSGNSSYAIEPLFNRIYNRLDTNSSGDISRSELEDGITNLQLSPRDNAKVKAVAQNFSSINLLTFWNGLTKTDLEIFDRSQSKFDNFVDYMNLSDLTTYTVREYRHSFDNNLKQNSLPAESKRDGRDSKSEHTQPSPKLEHADLMAESNRRCAELESKFQKTQRLLGIEKNINFGDGSILVSLAAFSTLTRYGNKLPKVGALLVAAGGIGLFGSGLVMTIRG